MVVPGHQYCLEDSQSNAKAVEWNGYSVTFSQMCLLWCNLRLEVRGVNDFSKVAIENATDLVDYSRTFKTLFLSDFYLSNIIGPDLTSCIDDVNTAIWVLLPIA